MSLLRTADMKQTRKRALEVCANGYGEIFPECNGYGKYYYYDGHGEEDYEWCRNCRGKGYVEK